MSKKKPMGKTAKMQGVVIIILLIVSIATLALYTGSQPGNKPLIKLQTKESLEGVTGRAVTGMVK